MLIADCPRCGKRSVLGPENRWRPFCSERCKMLDLGAWFDGRHAIPVAPEDGASLDDADDQDQ